MLDLRSKARQRLLAYYFTNPTARHHLRDLAEKLSVDPSNLSKELGRLAREGLFQSEVSGRQKYFRLNRAYPLFEEVRSIVGKTIGAIPLIAQSIKKVERIEDAYLYGSFAGNQQDATSVGAARCARGHTHPTGQVVVSFGTRGPFGQEPVEPSAGTVVSGRKRNSGASS